MESVPDWVLLWRQLVEMPRRFKAGGAGMDDSDVWRDRARRFDDATRRKWSRPDPVRDFVLSHAGPDTTVLDVGAGTGRWSLHFARTCRQVTAVEPSAAMVEVMKESIRAEGVDNVEIVQGAWPDVDVRRHDISLCSHAMYMCPDLPAFVRRMVAVTRKTCFLLARIPSADGVMGQVFQHLYGQPHDSPNFVVAHNALLQIGIYPNVMVDPGIRTWKSASLPDALHDLKRRLGLADESRHDEYFMEVLKDRLRWKDGEYVWPDGMRSGLIYWSTG